MSKTHYHSQRLSREKLAALLQNEDVAELSFSALVRLYREEPGLAGFRPDGGYQIDPRNGERIIFNAARARRPHDNRPVTESRVGLPERPCVVCQGQTTGIIDMAELSEGVTFINKNLYPLLFPAEEALPGRVQGLHLLQWTSSLHDRDWHNLPLVDCVVVMERLAALEKLLLTQDVEGFLPEATNPTGERAFVSIIKNYGRLVGGSLAHGHQQIALSNIIPRRFLDNWRFEQERGETFAAYMLRENPPELLVRDYGPAVLLVSYFMRRPYNMLLILKESGRRYLHELSAVEMEAVATGWRDAIHTIRELMPRMGRETAYNVVTHNGPGAGLYFEFLPYTQEIGGYEHLGLFSCQERPENVAAQLRETLGDRRELLRHRKKNFHRKDAKDAKKKKVTTQPSPGSGWA
ncbi:MAG: hypothetical protein K8R89_02465 [Anaerolineae bacterium]|nr:hypothetical protein [Anaerolineae bacterium]